MPNSHRATRRDENVELRRVGDDVWTGMSTTQYHRADEKNR